MTNDQKYWVKIWNDFKANDVHAFEEIYNEFSDVLYAYGSKITNNKELIKDSIQDLFIDLYRYKLELKNPERLEYYLFRSLKNKLFREIKKLRAVASIREEGISEFTMKFDYEEEEIQRESEQLQLKYLTDILNKLDPAKRELLFLKFNTGLSNTEIAELLNMKPETVKKQIYRLLQSVKLTYGLKLLELLVLCLKS